MRICCERFKTLHDFVRAIETRPDNGHARTSSLNGSEHFAGMPLADAYISAQTGLPDVANRVKRELVKFSASCAGTITKRRPTNYYSGYAPNVPAAIIGLPKSMRKIVKEQRKVKTISIYFNTTEAHQVTAGDLEKAGMCVLKLLYMAEISGYRVELNVVNWLASTDKKGARYIGEKAVCIVHLKQYGQPLDILKTSFPIASISMFRRLGFKWLETMPSITDDKWSDGYGYPIREREAALSTLKEAGIDLKNSYYIRFEDCESAGFDPQALAAKLDIVI